MASTEEQPSSPSPETAINISLPDDDDEEGKNESSTPPEPENASPSETETSNPEPVVAFSTIGGHSAEIQTNGKDVPAEKKTQSSDAEKTKNSDSKKSFWPLTAFFFLVTLIILLFVFILLGFSEPTTENQRQQQNQQLSLRRNKNQTTVVHCTTAACLAASQSIAASMDFGADPCVDFYNYSCGSWSRVNSAEIEQSIYVVNSRFTLLATKVSRQLKELLGDNSTTINKNNDNNNNTSSSASSKSVTLAKELYQRCVPWRKASRYQSNASYVEPLHRKLAAIFGNSKGEWPFLELDSYISNNKTANNSSNNTDLNYATKNETLSNSLTNQKEVVQTLMSLLAFDSAALVDFFLDVDLGNRNGPPLFYFTLPSTFKDDRPLYANPEAYRRPLLKKRESIFATMSRFFTFSPAYQQAIAENSNGSSSSSRRSKLSKLIMKSVQKVMLQRATEVADLERQLVLASSPRDQLKTTQESLHRITLRELNELVRKQSTNLTNHFDWTLFPTLFSDQFNLKLEKNITENTLVAVSDIEYFTQLPAILARTPPTVLYNYLGWKLISAYYEPPNKLEYYFPLNGESWCFELVTGLLDRAVSRLYLEEEVGVTRAKESKLQAEAMVKRMRRSLRRIMATDQMWLDGETRIKALEKEAATKYSTAYPDWLLDNEALDGHYGLDEQVYEDIINGSQSSNENSHFLEAVFALRRHRMATFAARRSGFITRSAKLGAANINAFAIPFANAIVLPAALLQLPLFDVDRPAYLNLASIGAVIGHEATHHFDYNGRAFGADGSLMAKGTNGWWTQETAEHFEAAAKCFVRQYDNVTDPWTGKQLKGNLTLKENMADQGGLWIAYGAAFDDEEEDSSEIELLPGKLETFTAEQLFFVTYAQTWCAHYADPKYLAYQIDTDTHAPERYRVNIPLANYAPFARAFSCPAEGYRSAMNRAKSRC